MPSEITGIDITVPATRPEVEVANILNEWCSKWVFQEERGIETGYIHYQIRARLLKAKYIKTIEKQWSEILPGCHVSATSNEVHSKASFNYVMKAETRTRGPWTNESQPKHITRQLRAFMELELYDWQKEISEQLLLENDRDIIVIIDQTGNTGKSIFTEYLQYHGLALKIPLMNCMEDIMQYAMSHPPAKSYVIDMPRGLRKDKLASFYGGIEELKNGFMYDKRYSAKSRYIDRPNIVIFTNEIPDTKMMSKDRWKLFCISSKMNLIQCGLNDATLGASL